MNRINADRDGMIRSLIGLFLFLFCTALFLTVGIESASVLPLVLSVFFFLATLLSLRVLNRSSAIIIYQDGALTRRGRLFGFHKTFPTDKIVAVYHIDSKKFGNRLYVADRPVTDLKSKTLDPEHKDSMISLTYCQASLQFLRQFYQGEIYSSIETEASEDD